jgi:hypothetical protein
MSRAQKAMRSKMAIRKGVQELKVWNRNLEKKKAEMIGFAQTAKMHGIPAQYALAVSGLKMILTQQKRAMSMTLQMQLVETMRDLSTMSSGFVKLIGNVGKEISKITGKVDFFKNQEAFQEGMMSMDGLMMQMESFLDSNAEPMQDVAGTDEISDSDIEKLIDVTASAGEDKVESEIEKKLEEVKRSLNA